MKKKIRSQISLFAKQLIAQEDAFDTRAMKQTVGQLYEKLAVLEYLESQLEEPSSMPTKESLDSKSFREENWFTEPEPLPQSEHKDDLVEPLMEKIKDIVAQMPEETQQVDEMLEEVIPQHPPAGRAGKYVKNDLEEFASNYQQTPTFERKQPSKGVDVVERNLSETFPKDQKTKNHPTTNDSQSFKPRSLNDTIQQGLSIGLNDRLAFVKHLFDGNTEDYTRVLSQLSTMKSYEEAATFIKGRIKPDYNYWLHKEEYSERFMGIIEKSFN